MANNADVLIRVGAKGEFAVGGESGELIRKQLEAQLVKGIQVKIGIDEAQVSKALKAQLSNVGKNLKFNIGTQVTGAGKSGKSEWDQIFRQSVKDLTAPNVDLRPLNNYYKEQERLSDSFLKKNLNGIDMEIKAREQQAKIFSNQIKTQMKERIAAENEVLAHLNKGAPIKSTQANFQKYLMAVKASAAELKQLQSSEWDRMFRQSVKGLTAPNLDLRPLNNYYKEQERLSNSLSKQNLNGIDMEIRAREQQAKIFSNQIKAQMKERIAAENEVLANLNKNASIKSTQASFQKYLTTVKASAAELKQIQIQDIFSKLNTGQLKEAQIAIRALKADFKAMGAEGGNVFTYLGEKMKTFAVYLMSSTLTMAFVRSIRKAIDLTFDLNEAMVNLRIVTNGNQRSAEELLKTYNRMAMELGSTTVAVANSAIEWQRQGHNLKDTNTLIKDSMVLSIVGMVDSADAAQYLTSAIKGNFEIFPLRIEMCA